MGKKWTAIVLLVRIAYSILIALIDEKLLMDMQVLLKPIVSQLVIEPPTSIEEHPDIPSVKEVDDLLVVCIGQMAVTAGTDLLWKPLNHEVIKI